MERACRKWLGFVSGMIPGMAFWFNDLWFVEQLAGSKIRV